MKQTHRMFIFVPNQDMQEVSGDKESIYIIARLLLSTQDVMSVRILGLHNSEDDCTYDFSEDVPNDY